MILITSYYQSQHPERQKEIDECLFRNMKNPLISRIYLLNDKIYPLLEEEKEIEKNKIIQVNMKKRIDYQDAFSYANEHFSGEICILANSDMYYDDTLSLFDMVKDWKNIFFAISRYNNGIIESGCQGSQDTWVFKSPVHFIHKHNDHELNFNFGIPGCDNRVVYIFHKNGYKIVNPCKDIITHHLHQSNLRTYTEKQRIKGPVLYVHPSGLFPEKEMTSRYYAYTL